MGTLRFTFNEAGVKFWILPQKGFAPVIVPVTPAYGQITAGPKDDAIYVKDAKNKSPYKDETGRYNDRPPWKNGHYPAVRPEGGHFLHIKSGTREFLSTAAFATIRCTLEIWRYHFETADFPWFFREPATLEVIPRVKSANAFTGQGFLEFGFANYPSDGYKKRPLAANFDAVAHETGHLIMKSVLGNPPFDERSTQYRAHEEAAADLIAILAALHFDSVADEALESTKGLLYGVTALTRMTEWGSKRNREEMRRLFNELTMEEVRKEGEPDRYELSKVFSGAAFDVLVRMLHRNLAERGAITEELAALARHVPGKRIPAGVQSRFETAYRQSPFFKAALLEVRDYFARVLARAWRAVPHENLTFAKVLLSLLDAEAQLARELGRPSYADLIRETFELRGIQPER